MYAGATANRSGPSGSRSFQFCKQGAAQAEVSLLALEFEQALVGLTVAMGMLVDHTGEKLFDYFGCLRYPSSKLETTFEITELFFELKQPQLFETGIENRQQSIGHRKLNASQLPFWTNNGRLFGKELVPQEANVFELPLQREPSIFLPVQALLDGVAELHQRFLDLLTYLC